MCNAHNHKPGCTCGWGGTSYVDDSEKAFDTLFGRLAKKKKKKVVHEDMSSSKSKFRDLFDIDSKPT